MHVLARIGLAAIEAVVLGAFFIALYVTIPVLAAVVSPIVVW